MATITTGLGGPQGVGEGNFHATTLNAANGGTGNYDDGSLKVNITSVFGAAGINYFGTNYTSIYINTNGLITFAAPNLTYQPTNISTLTQPAIAAFWSDVNITAGNVTGTNNIYWDLDPASGRVTVTWLGVKGYSGTGNNTNTFQVVLQKTHDGNFEITFKYQQIQWTNGGSGIAQTGLTNGGTSDYPLPGSGNATALAAYPNATLDPGQVGGVWSTRYLGTRPVCFVAGTVIATPQGPCAVENLVAGQRIDTLDDGPQPVRWVGGGGVIAHDTALPVTIAAGVLGNARALGVSGQHLLMLEGVDCELLFGEAQVFVCAKDLIGLPGVRQETHEAMVRYHHILLDRHQVIFAEGAATESLHPGPMALSALPSRARAELEAVFMPYEMARFSTQPAARRVLKPHEARVLVNSRLRGAFAAAPLAHRMARVV